MVDRSDGREIDIVERGDGSLVGKQLVGYGSAGNNHNNQRDNHKRPGTHGQTNGRMSNGTRGNKPVNKRDPQNPRNNKNPPDEKPKVVNKNKNNRVLKNKMKNGNGENRNKEAQGNNEEKEVLKTHSNEDGGHVEKGVSVDKNKDTNEGGKIQNVKNQKPSPRIKTNVQKNVDGKKKPSSPKQNNNRRRGSLRDNQNKPKGEDTHSNAEKNENKQKVKNAQPLKPVVKIFLPPVDGIDELGDELKNVTFGGTPKADSTATSEVTYDDKEEVKIEQPLDSNNTSADVQQTQVSVVQEGTHPTPQMSYMHYPPFVPPYYNYHPWEYQPQHHYHNNHKRQQGKNMKRRNNYSGTDYKGHDNHYKNDYEKKNDHRNYEDESQAQMHSQQFPFYYHYPPMMIQPPTNQMVPYIYHPYNSYNNSPYGTSYSERNVNSDSEQTLKE